MAIATWEIPSAAAW